MIRAPLIGGSFAILVLCSAAVHADGLPGEVLLFSQQPMVQKSILGQPYYGHGELSTAEQLPLGAPFDGYAGPFMADDFAVETGHPIGHVRFWGSYDGNQLAGQAQKFFITFETNVPAGPNIPFSQPGTPLVSQIVTAGALSPGSGTFTERPIHAGGSPLNQKLFEYSAELATPFVPEPNTVYWLKIAALADVPAGGTPDFQWGWHNRDYSQTNALAPIAPNVTPGESMLNSPIPVGQPPVWHFQGDAVEGHVSITDFLVPGTDRFGVTQSDMAPLKYTPLLDGPSFVGDHPSELAFELYGVPEPSTVILGVLGAAIAMSLAWRARRRRWAAAR